MVGVSSIWNVLVHPKLISVYLISIRSMFITCRATSHSGSNFLFGWYFIHRPVSDLDANLSWSPLTSSCMVCSLFVNTMINFLQENVNAQVLCLEVSCQIIPKCFPCLTSISGCISQFGHQEHRRASAWSQTVVVGQFYAISSIG